ncbi:MAG: tRNA 4-thiouridine(8) synthase ThiI [Spirochaetaceae bacterium]|jgi:thiamine biosynthesis protein ThiI|nr:tRNA 4-thiouridine(8) synthase ThiI [Spirochaetaceae bacterium]
MAVYLAKLGELTLKGANKRDFERRLVENARLGLEKVDARVRLQSARLYVEGPEESSAAIEFTLSHLIGITGWARTRVCEKTIEAITQAVYDEAVARRDQGARTFKVETRRQDKSFPLDSYGVNTEAPSRVVDENVLAVDVHRPDALICVEIRERVFVYSNAHRGCRGLPVGTSGKGVLLLSGGLDSPVAGYRMLRRGMRLDYAHFHAWPYTSDEAKQKALDLARLLAAYGCGGHINMIPFAEVQTRIRERAPGMFSTLLLRVCMIKAANLLAAKVRAEAIITGESLGQVASQTMRNMAVTEDAAEFPLYRPLIGLDKEEIIETSRSIGAYETSILPYEDCCVLFAPKHPALRATVEESRSLYAALEADSLIQDAFDRREKIALPVV